MVQLAVKAGQSGLEADGVRYGGRRERRAEGALKVSIC
jgi:hypothetical protein